MSGVVKGMGDAQAATRVTVPDAGDWPATVAFPAALAQLPRTGSFAFDFSHVRFATPGWMLVVGGALAAFRAAREQAGCRAENYKGPSLRYAAHAGFFRSFGMDYGQATGAVGSTDAFIPITTVDVDELRGRAAEGMMHHGDLIQEESERMVTLLTRLDAGEVFETLAYSIRELVRNVVEHSESPDYSFAAQWWPASGEAELAVADRGMGVARSLRRNPRNAVPDDAAALELATRPGVSSRGRPRRSDGAWSNSGYGLYMTRSLCSAAGVFTLMSGGAALISDQDGAREHECRVEGTTVVMRLRTRALGDLSATLSRLRDVAGGKAKPSLASLSTRVRS